MKKALQISLMASLLMATGVNASNENVQVYSTSSSSFESSSSMKTGGDKPETKSEKYQVNSNSFLVKDSSGTKSANSFFEKNEKKENDKIIQKNEQSSSILKIDKSGPTANLLSEEDLKDISTYENIIIDFSNNPNVSDDSIKSFVKYFTDLFKNDTGKLKTITINGLDLTKEQKENLISSAKTKDVSITFDYYPIAIFEKNSI